MALQRIYDRPHPFRRYVPVALHCLGRNACDFQLVLAGCRKTVLQTAVRIVKKRKPFSTIKRRDVQSCRKGLSMLDIKRVLKAAPTKMRSREPLQQLWTPWGERIDHEWLSARAGNKAFNPAEEGERTLDEGRTPILGEHPRPTMVRDNCTMLNGWWDYAIASIPEDETAPKWRKTAAMLTRDEAVRAVKETAIPQTFDGKILVPFSPESALSGVHQTITPTTCCGTAPSCIPSRSAERKRSGRSATRIASSCISKRSIMSAPAMSTASSRGHARRRLPAVRRRYFGIYRP